ncbi:AAI domain-containing protein [Psidium guajava]|nr:AAI domain-containing protein [Psidium guajava]
MTRKGPSPFVASFLMTALVVSSQLVPGAEAGCDATQLAPCLPSFMPPFPPPTDTCCGKLKEQQPCFCDYMKDPRFGKYVKSPRAKEVLRLCKIPTLNVNWIGPKERRSALA